MRMHVTSADGPLQLPPLAAAPPPRPRRRNPTRSSRNVATNVSIQPDTGQPPPNQDSPSTPSQPADQEINPTAPPPEVTDQNPFFPSRISSLSKLNLPAECLAGHDLTLSNAPVSLKELQVFLNKKQRVMAQLYSTADSAGAPKYLVDELMNILKAANSDHGFQPTDPDITTRKPFMKSLQQTFGVPPPEEIPIKLEVGRTVTVSRNCFPRLLQDHLLSDTYRSLSNLDLPDPNQPFSSKPTPPMTYDNITQSYWFRQAYLQHQQELDSGTAILHPLIIYMDKTGVDQIMKNSLEPVACTSALLNQSQRQDIRNWMVLGFIPNLSSKKRKKARDLPFPSPSSTPRDYHRCLAAVLAPLKLLQKSKPVMIFRRGDTKKALKLICPVVSVIGDNLSQNSVAGMLNNTGPSSVRMSRCCLTPYQQSDDVPHICSRFPTALQKRLILAALSCKYCHNDPVFRSSNWLLWESTQPPTPITKSERESMRRRRSLLAYDVLKKCLGSQCILNAFDGVDLGPQSCINTSTTTDLMHSFESGLLNYVLQILFPLMTPGHKKMIDDQVEKLFGAKGHSRSSQRKFLPRVSFTRGFCSLTLLSSHERVGKLFVVALLLNTSKGFALFGERFRDDFDATREARTNRSSNTPEVAQQQAAPDVVAANDTNLDMDEDPMPEQESPDEFSQGIRYSQTEKETILRHLQLWETLEQLRLYLPEQHRAILDEVIDNQLKPRGFLDNIASILPTQDVFGGVSPDYCNPATADDTPTDPVGGWPLQISELLHTPDFETQVFIDSERLDCSIKLNINQFLELAELMLCYHSFLKYGASMLHDGLHSNILGYKRNLHKMLMSMTKGLKRDDQTYQFRLQKFVECNHFLMDHLFRGPPASFNTSTGESGLKTWAKLPAIQAQNRGDATFRPQAARNLHHKYLLDAATAKPVPYTTEERISPNSVRAVGKTFVYLFRGPIHGFFLAADINKPTFSQDCEQKFPGVVSRWFERHLRRWYERQLEENPAYQLVIQIITELKLPMEGQEEFLELRAHPNFNGEGPWYDYATIPYEHDGASQGVFPARCVCFFQLPNDVPKNLVQAAVSFEQTNEIFALVQESKYQVGEQAQHRSRICSKYTLNNSRGPNRGTYTATLSCVVHNCFESGVFAFDQDLGDSQHDPYDPFVRYGDERDMVFDIVVVKDRRTEWSKSFLTPPS